MRNSKQKKTKAKRTANENVKSLNDTFAQWNHVNGIHSMNFIFFFINVHDFKSHYYLPSFSCTFFCFLLVVVALVCLFFFFTKYSKDCSSDLSAWHATLLYTRRERANERTSA